MIRNLFIFSIFISMCSGQNDVSHIVIRLDGTSDVGMIDSINTDNVFIHSSKTEEEISIPLNDVYYIYNSYGKLYYISPNYRDRLNLIEERSGYVVTIENDTIQYTAIQIDRRMDQPFVYLATEAKALGHKLSIFDVHLIRIDASYMEHSVRRGAITGLCSMLTGITLQTFSNYSEKSDALASDATFGTKVNTMGSALFMTIGNFMPNGKQYQSVTIMFPVSAMGWMVYDYMYDKRTHYFRPLIREDQFPHSMYWFNPWRIVKDRVSTTLAPVLNLWPF